MLMIINLHTVLEDEKAREVTLYSEHFKEKVYLGFLQKAQN